MDQIRELAHTTWPWVVSAGVVTAAVISNLKTVLDLWDRITGKGPRIDVGFTSTSSEEIGHTVIVSNLSDRPLMLSHWAVVWETRRFFRKTLIEYEEQEEYDWAGTTVKAHDRFVLTFAEQNYFSTKPKNRIGYKLRLRLWMTGERSFRSYDLRS